MNRSGFLGTISVLAIWAASSSGLVAEEVEGLVSSVGAGSEVEIRLAEGLVVAPGDPVEILAEIPGAGLMALDTRWAVESYTSGTATARPLETPSGAPQVGYVARIETQASTTDLPGDHPAGEPNTRSASEEPEVTEETVPTDGVVSPDQTVLEDVSPTEGADVFFRRGMELTASDDPVEIASGVDHLRRAATMRHPGAMTELGAAFGFGRGIDRDDEMAVSWHNNAAKLGNTRAMARLGLIYLLGRGVPADEFEGARWLQQASESGNPKAMFLLAMLYEDGHGVPSSLENVVSWLEEAAAHGHLEAMYHLGDIYLDGEDGIIPKDVYKVEDYWLAAARAGHVGAMKELSEFYEGESTEAAQHWKKAARMTPRRPEYLVNPTCLSEWECYERENEGVANSDPDPAAPSAAEEPTRPDRSPRVIYVVQDCDRFAASPRDPDRADLDQSVEYADLDAQRVISECLEDIDEWPDTRRFYAQIARGYFKAGMQTKAFEAATTGAQLGSGQAMALLGMMYKNGNHVAEDPYEALRWLEKAGYEGNMSAMHFAAGMHLHSQGVPYNPQAAVKWFKAAADLGSSQAYKDLGILYDNGEGVPYDPEEAAMNLIIGLSTGSEQAKEMLLQNPNSLTLQTRIAIQQLLRRDGWYTGALDGDFGPGTQRALRARIIN